MSDESGCKDTIPCSNCKRDVLKANFMIHELHCQRYIYLCSKCNEPVNCKQKDVHEKENHFLVFCKDCHVHIEKFLLNKHLSNDCPYRKLKCQICDVEVRATDISEHENYCGSRTEKCLECGEYIMFKYKQLHNDSNHTFIKLSDEPGPSASWQSARRTLGNFLPDSEPVTRKSQTNQKKKSGKNENRLRRSRGSLEFTAKSDETVKESSSGETKDGNAFLEKNDRMTQGPEEFRGVSGYKTDRKAEKPTLKKSLSSAAALHSVDSPDVNSDLNKDTESLIKKGKGNLSKIGVAASESASKDTSNSDRKNKSSNEIDEDKLIARAIDENAAVLSEFSLLDPLEKKKTLPGKNLSVNVYNGKSGKTVRKPRLYEQDDSSDDDFLLYSKNSEKDLDYDGLPCQFCGTLYSPYTLMPHQQKCILNEDSHRRKNKQKSGQDETEGGITCAICSQIVPFSRYTTHQILHKLSPKNRSYNSAE